nr:gamma-soluble NSF attachment protein isoform X2 [Arachis hypogaea]
MLPIASARHISVQLLSTFILMTTSKQRCVIMTALSEFLPPLLIDAFCKSDQNRCASNLLAAYSDGDIEEIKRIAQSSSISNLDHSMIRLARKLPTGDVSALKGNTARQEDQPLDENDLT